eukprot:TRINITY_DN44375_c0_g2_i1.p1 TRINITY_DN44375_c0_g2~~TRINITY_DN44375_c0_g2_i1.p1  ORF type:complete len:800 (-),score=124.10 TRINITY_DN44375_c0_g2_i1:238-2637(-)
MSTIGGPDDAAGRTPTSRPSRPSSSGLAPNEHFSSSRFSGSTRIEETPVKLGLPVPGKADQEACDDDNDDDVGAELFESLARQPYATMETLISSRASSPRCESEDAHLYVRNLDTGEARRLGDGALGHSFVGEYMYPDCFQADHLYRPWKTWWLEKQANDERLWHAAETGCIADVRAALVSSDGKEGGPPVDVNSKSLHGRTALHIAASVGEPACVEALLDAGANIHQRTDYGNTVLHIACQRGHLDVVSLLLAWGAELCCDAADGNLPIHLAASGGHKGVVKMLLERKASQQVHVRNRYGQRPSEVAQNIEVAELFQRIERDGIGCADGVQDLYAGRTPYYKGGVLLHNSRADHVRNILHKTQCLSNGEDFAGLHVMQLEWSLTTPYNRRASRGTGGDSTPWSPGGVSAYSDFSTRAGMRSSIRDSPSASSPGRRSQRSFARLRPNGSGIEQVGPDSFELVRLLGKGSFGEVFHVKHKRTRLEYAMKILQKSKIVRQNLLKYAMTERNVLSYIHHPYIVGLHYAFQTANHLVMVLEFCPRGSLQQKITEEKRLPEAIARLYDAEVLLALGHLHQRHIVYRDLKPENVVIDAEAHCMLTDFGLSKEGVAGIRGARSFCGSLAFLAPEILGQRGHGSAVDIYGLGVMLHAMLTGLPPFYHRDRETLLANIRHQQLQVPAYVSQQAASLIHALMDREPSRRLGATRTAEVQSHPFFASVDFQALMRREVPVPGDHQPQRQAPDRQPPGSPFVVQNRGGGVVAAMRAVVGGGSPVATQPGPTPNPIAGWEFSNALSFRGSLN